MTILLARLLARLQSWSTPILVVLVVFATSWPLMALAEPAGAEIVRPENYWWFFIITASTVGYGDFFPTTGAGHAVGAYVLAGGIITLSALFTKMITRLDSAKGRRMSGSGTITTTGHLVILGYEAGRSERIIQQLLADGCGEIVLCAWDDTSTHPMPEQPVQFVRGALTDEDVLRRAGVHRARAVLVDVRDDNEALAVAVTIDHVVVDVDDVADDRDDHGVHVVVTLRDMEQATLVRYVDEGIHCVQWHSPRMITEELTSPGIAEVYGELMGASGASTYSVRLDESVGAVTVEHCQATLARAHGASLLAVRADGRLVVNPAWDTTLPAGATLYYVSPQRLTADQVAGRLARHPIE